MVQQGQQFFKAALSAHISTQLPVSVFKLLVFALQTCLRVCWPGRTKTPCTHILDVLQHKQEAPFLVLSTC